MKIVTVVFVLLIMQFAGSVSCAAYSEEEIPNDVKECPQGYCVKIHQCHNGTINFDGIDILQARFGNADRVEIGLDDQNDPCEEFLLRCCSSNKNRDLLRMEPTLPTDPTPSTCGANYPNGYIYHVRNSSIAQFAEFPWMAALLQRREYLGDRKLEYFCGGSLIHPKVVLTAAHCLRNRNELGDLVVRLGEWDTVTENEPLPYQELGVSKTIVHKKYVDNKFHNDLALLIMDSEAGPEKHISPICLPTVDDNFDDMRCMVSGWGKENFEPEGKYSEVLKKVEVPVVTRKKCEKMFQSTQLGGYFRLHSSFMCAGGEPGVDVCKGDGGSPLACKSDDHFVQAGIVAAGLGCGEEGIPGLYVKVSNFVNWIQTTLLEEGIEL